MTLEVILAAGVWSLVITGCLLVALAPPARGERPPAADPPPLPPRRGHHHGDPTLLILLWPCGRTETFDRRTRELVNVHRCAPATQRCTWCRPGEPCPAHEMSSP